MFVFEPEKDDGCVEYKLKLTSPTPTRLNSLASQMRFRCEEGGGECIYRLGVEDDGTASGITEAEFVESVSILNSVAGKNSYSVMLLSSREINNNDLPSRKIYEILIRENNKTAYVEIKACVIGSVDSGKSTSLSVLINGKLDDGRGSARVSVFNYPHEIKSGRTSSMSHHILGFDNNGHQIFSGTWREIIHKSSKIISFIDLAGHEKYIKTTILGMSASQPDICVLVVSANKGIGKMTIEHVFLCISLGIPFIILLTKIDMITNRSEVYINTMAEINRMVKSSGIRRLPLKIEKEDDCVLASIQIYNESIVPIFPISNTSGQGIDLVRHFLNILPRKPQKSNQQVIDDVEFMVDAKWNVIGVGLVLGGFLSKGKIKVGDTLFIGVVNDGYEKIYIKSIQVRRVPVSSVDYQTYLCMGIKKVPFKIKRGMVVVNTEGGVVSGFTANIKVVKTTATIGVGYEPILYCRSLRQTCKIMNIFNKISSRECEEGDCILRSGDTASVEFKLKYRPEFIYEGLKILLCDGSTKITGIIVEVKN